MNLSNEIINNQSIDCASLEEFIDVRKVKEFIEEVETYCYKNNTIPMKDTNLKLAILDGGWVNVMNLMNFIKEKAGNKLI